MTKASNTIPKPPATQIAAQSEVVKTKNGLAALGEMALAGASVFMLISGAEARGAFQGAP